MSVRKYRILDTFDGTIEEGDPYIYSTHLSYESQGIAKILMQTGVSDRNGIPIFEGDTLRQKSCEIPFVVEDIVSFLLMCGRYEEKHGMPIFDSLEIVND